MNTGKVRALLCFLLILPLSLVCRIRAASADAPAAWTVSADSITDNRSANLAAGSSSTIWMNNLSLTLGVHGSASDDIGATGNVVVTQAVDDLGENLNTQDHSFSMGSKNMTAIDDNARKNGITVQLQLDSPKRSAAKLTSVEGHFDLRVGGKTQIVTSTALPALSGKPLTDPALTTAGITAFQITDAAAGSTSISMQISGNLAAIKDVQVINAAGDHLISGHSWGEMNGMRDAQYTLKSPLDANCKLQITLVLGQKTETVPFHLKDIPLP